ncbi:hypothetical protein LXL04_018897 [Taraxacum kok-saghyz]
MALSTSTAKIVSSFIVEQCSIASRRGYASASQNGGVSEVVRGRVVTMMKKGGEESTKSNAWIPDPVTGYYKPEGQGNQIDPAELLELHKQQNAQHIHDVYPGGSDYALVNELQHDFIIVITCMFEDALSFVG